VPTSARAHLGAAQSRLVSGAGEVTGARHEDQDPAGHRLVVLPDLDRELTAALGDVEELLLTLRWQETGDPDDHVVHPVALGGGVALRALRRVADTVRPTQTDPEASTGRRLLGPDGRYEDVALRFVRVRTTGHTAPARPQRDAPAADVRGRGV